LTSLDRSPLRQRIILIVIVILLLGVWALGLTRFDRPTPERRALLGQLPIVLAFRTPNWFDQV
jgi:hypothetical protein